MALDRWGEKLGVPRTRLLHWDIRAGFEPLRARDIAGHLSNHRNRYLTGRSKSTGDATCAARLQTGAGESKRLALSWGAPSFSPHRPGAPTRHPASS
jgi:hypothetical protein